MVDSAGMRNGARRVRKSARGVRNSARRVRNSARRVRESARGGAIVAVIRVDSRIRLVGHARGVNSRSRVVLVVTSKSSSRVVDSGINAVGCGGRVRSGAIGRGVVSVHPGLLGHAGCGGGVAGRDVCVSGCARRTVTGRGGCSAIVVGA